MKSFMVAKIGYGNEQIYEKTTNRIMGFCHQTVPVIASRDAACNVPVFIRNEYFKIGIIFL